MSHLPISSKYRSRPGEVPTPEDREDLVTRLNGAFANGTIDQDAYQELLDRVFDAKNFGELAPVAEVLPVKQTYGQPAIVAQTGSPGEVTPSRNPRQTALIMAASVGGVVALVLLAIIVIGMLL